MAVAFNNIPANIRVPLFWAEVNNSQASYFQQNQRALLIGQKLPTGSGAINEPLLVTSVDQAIALFGAGSYLHSMMETYRQNDDFGEVWCLAMGDPLAGQPARGTIQFSGAQVESGTLYVYIAGQLIRIPVAIVDSNATLANALTNVINATVGLPVTASAAGATVTIIAKHAGFLGNDIDLRLNWRGLPGGERTPVGLNVAIVPLSGGTDSPDLATALAGLGDEEFDFVCAPYTDGTSLRALHDEWDDQTGRWAWSRQIYGHVFGARRGTVAQLQTFGQAQNDQHMTVIGYNDSPSPPWEWSAAWVAQSAKSLRIDPARPLQTLELVGIEAPILQRRFTTTEKQTLLFSGIATFSASRDGKVRIERSITTYQRNEWQQPDPSYLDVETLYTLAFIIRYMRQAVTQKFGRHKLANDDTRYGAGQAIVTPKVVRNELIAQYSSLIEQGVVENIEAFKVNLLVERAVNDPNRLNILYTPDLVNQLRIFAVNAEFRLQYPVN